MGLIIRSSGIHAIGCYTTAPIAEGARIVEYTGDVITIEEGDVRYEGRDDTYLFGLNDEQHVIDGYGMAAYINHSCDGNCETDEIEGRVWIFAARDIEAGEELTYDYDLYDGEGDAPCFCGAKDCRGTMYAPYEIKRRAREAAQARKAEKHHARKREPSRKQAS
jgi:SET domain-containing protein